MSVGKYSPTVSFMYARDQNWFEKNGGGYGNGNDPESDYDDDGYDSYGYNRNDIDRAGNAEFSYLASNSYLDGESYYHLYESVSDEWRARDILKERDARISAKEDPEICLLMDKLDELKDIQRKAALLEEGLKENIKKKMPNLYLD